MKKICVMLIALSLVLSVLSGCGKTDTVEASLNDIVLVLGETRALPSKIMIGEEEKTLTYQFEGSSISIENYVLVALVENTETTVTASADSFTVALWIKADTVTSDPCIFANKDWQTGRNQGYALAIRNDVVRWNFGDGKNRLDCDVQTPKDYADGWMHIIASVDRESNQLRLCIDFQTVVSVDIPTGMQGMSFDTPFNGLHIGQDATGAYATALPAVIDELMIFDGALDTDDVQALAAYFGRPNP